MLEFIGQFFAGLLIGYLSLTNALAAGIQQILPHGIGPIATDIQNFRPKEPEIILNISEKDPKGVIPKVLLEHSAFQKAAVLASSHDEEVPLESDLSLEERIEAALVNIYCQYKTDSYIRTTTGTGFFINSKGIILTNAHVAQFLLLEDTRDIVKDVDCVIRSGDPATPRYKAELLYISPTWIFENSNVITEESPRGTGERDYALLYISKSTDNSPLPARFPSIAVNTDLLSRSTEQSQVLTAGYPAEALLRNGADAKLAPVVASTTVGTLYTFGSNFADIFSINESPVGEQGASGGPIVAPTQEVIGLIVTKGDEDSEGINSLRALTLSYVDRTIIEETGFSLSQNMQGDVAYRGTIFKQAMVPFLAGILQDELNSAQ
jgi:S1-C subfamily serine protease